MAAYIKSPIDCKRHNISICGELTKTTDYRRCFISCAHIVAIVTKCALNRNPMHLIFLPCVTFIFLLLFFTECAQCLICWPHVHIFMLDCRFTWFWLFAAHNLILSIKPWRHLFAVESVPMHFCWYFPPFAILSSHQLNISWWWSCTLIHIDETAQPMNQNRGAAKVRSRRFSVYSFFT